MVRKGSLVKFFEVSYYQKNFQPPTVHNSEDRGGMKMPYDFLFTFVIIDQQTADLEKITVVWNDRLIKMNVWTDQTFLYLQRLRNGLR